MEVGSLNPDTLEAGDEFFVTVGYNVSGSREGGPGMVRVINVTSEGVEGTFAGCVSLRDSGFGIEGPNRTVSGGFNATRN